MRAIDTDKLLMELQKCGTDERDIRPIMILARHFNSAIEYMRDDVEDIADERIGRYHRRNDYD